jgi:AraC-like DNA-binding protein
MRYFEYNLNVKILISAYSELDKSWKLTSTIDPYIRLYYISAGQGRVLCGRQDIFLKPGRFYLLPSHTRLTFWSASYINVYWAHIQLELLPGIDIFSVVKGKVMCLEKLDYSLVDEFRRLVQSGSETLAGTLTEQALMMKLTAAFFENHDIAIPEQYEKDLKRFEPAMNLLEKSPGHKCSVNELAHAVGLERVRFSTEFKRLFGVSPAKFIMKKRLDRAAGLLISSNRSLDDIADEFGFYDAFHFSKAFKSGKGMSPAKFRAARPAVQP